MYKSIAWYSWDTYDIRMCILLRLKLHYFTLHYSLILILSALGGGFPSFWCEREGMVTSNNSPRGLSAFTAGYYCRERKESITWQTLLRSYHGRYRNIELAVVVKMVLFLLLEGATLFVSGAFGTWAAAVVVVSKMGLWGVSEFKRINKTYWRLMGSQPLSPSKQHDGVGVMWTNYKSVSFPTWKPFLTY